MSWWKQPARHALAAKGILTRSSQAQLDRVGKRSAPMSFGYEHMLKKLAQDHPELTEVSEEDYDRAVTPLFDAVAEAEEFAERGDFQHSIDRLKLAAQQYDTLHHEFPVMTDRDAADFAQAVQTVTAKNVAGSRIKALQQVKVPVKPVATVSQQNVDDKSRGDERESH